MTVAQRGRYVLLVEDNDDSRDTLRMILEAQGYPVTSAVNGWEALETLKDAPNPCIILLDLMMPVMDGWEFMRRQGGDPALADIPTLLVTGAAEVGETPETVRMVGCLQKPIDPDTLLQTVGRHCLMR